MFYKATIATLAIVLSLTAITTLKPAKASAAIEGATIQSCFWAGIVVTYGANSACTKVAQTEINLVNPYPFNSNPFWPGLVVDGIYGPQTKGAITAFQNTHGLTPASTVVDGPTWVALYNICIQGIPDTPCL